MDEMAVLAGLLQERRTVIADHAWRDSEADAHLAALKDVSERITACAMRLGPGTPTRLRHFLESCSYDKALACLIQAGIQPGPPVD
jgi:hypothetical protein